MTRITFSSTATGCASVVIVDGKFTDVGIKTTNGYRIYKRAGDCSLAIADKLGDMIGKRLVLSPKREVQTNEVSLRAAIEAAV